MALRVLCTTTTMRVFGRISAQCNIFKNGSYYTTSRATDCEYDNTSFRSIPVVKFTDEINFINSTSYDPIPIYRVLGSTSETEALATIKLEKEKFTKIYMDMATLAIMDRVFRDAQRENRISFYLTHTGEEALVIASAAAFNDEDVIYTQYREAGILLWRGFKFEQFANQLHGNHEDIGKGRQMPIHYGSRELNFVTISSPLTTQLPQAVGAAYALKRSSPDRCVAVYFGEGAASEGDAHAAFNFAATLACPVIFICRNNGYAISTPAHEQYNGDGIAAKGPAYGIDTIRVDGNDTFAMYNATCAARNLSIEEGRPVLIEAMTYRVGDHSTSELYLNNDRTSVYRPANEIAEWEKLRPIERFRHCLEKLGLWSEELENDFASLTEEQIKTAFCIAESKQKPNWKKVFTDVYFDMPHHIKTQMDTMEKHVDRYREYYPVDLHKPSNE